MKFLVTGGAGGIGSTLCIELVKKGHEVIAYDNFSHGYENNLKENGKLICELEKADIRNTKYLIDVLEKNNIEYIIHLAALTSLPECESDPAECMSVNVSGTASVLDAAKMVKSVKRTIVASTSAIYENNTVDQSPFSENLTVSPRLMYPLSKKFTENLVNSYIKNYNLDAVCLRFFNVFGPRQDIHRPTPPLINYIVREIANNRKMTFYSTGRQVRDYIYVNDVVTMIEACINTVDLRSNVYNLCSGTLTSVIDIIHYAEKAFNKKLDYEFKQPNQYWANYKKIREGRPLSETVISSEVNKFALGSFTRALWELKWKPNTNIESLMIDTMRKNYELITK